MGEGFLILAFVVIVIGGIGSIRGAFYAAIITGLIDTLGRSFIDVVLLLVVESVTAETAGPAISSMLIYILKKATGQIIAVTAQIMKNWGFPQRYLKI